MKQIVLCIFLMSLFFSVSAQTKIGLLVSPGATITHVKDDRPESSGGLDQYGYLRNPSDGETTNGGNQTGLGVTFLLEPSINDKVSFLLGLGVVQKYIYIANRDANYFGTSKYGITYLQIPLALKIYFAEPAPNFKLFGKLGLTADIKAKETVDGGDYAHYWNLAKNRTDRDPVRGKNADHRSKNLFAPVNVGLLMGLGGEFTIQDITLSLGLSYNLGLLNTLNSGLKHDDINRTKVTDGLSIRTDLFTVDLGVALPLK